MSDAVATPKKAAAKAKKPAAKKADHPPVASMVPAAIAALKDRKGSSLSAIKKYIAANYKVDVVKLAPFIRRYLKKAVTDGKLNQVKGTGASGSFKLAKAATEEKKAKKPAAKKPAAKKPAAKKPAAKKSPKKAAKKPAAKKAKTPKKEKKAKKPAAAKPKKPKAKKATKSPKKAANKAK